MVKPSYSYRDRAYPSPGFRLFVDFLAWMGLAGVSFLLTLVIHS